MRHLTILLCTLAVTLGSSLAADPHPPASTEALDPFFERFVDGTFDPKLPETMADVQTQARRIARRGSRAMSGDFGEIAVLENDGTLVVGGTSNSDEIVRRFFESHPDQYEQVFLNFNFPMSPEAGFAFELNVANDVQGIGLPLYNNGATYGTVKLMSYLNQNDLAEYANFQQYNSILGQESGHRFGTFIDLQNCSNSAGFLLGRDCAHWNFYHNTLGSTLEGNNWTDNGNGTFSSSNAFSTYGELDEYLFGLRGETSVTQPLFVIENPTNCLRNGNPVNCPSKGSGPANNYTVTGTRTNFAMADIIAKYGSRIPDASTAPKTFRVAFIMVVDQGAYPPPAPDLAKLDGFRQQWETFFATETNGLGIMETRLYLPGEPPHPAFAADPLFGIPGTTVQFTDDTRNGPANTYFWTFGDGQTSTQPSPAHTYATPGLFDVSLTVSNANGSETRTRAAYINIVARAPQSEFTSDRNIGAAPLTVVFTDQTTWNPASWLWTFGDGQTSTQPSPTHTYTSANSAFTVTLTTTNAHGKNTRGKTNYIVTATPLFTEDFEAGGAGWTHGANAGIDDWELGPPLGKGGDPGSAFGGQNAYGTDLGNGTDGEYERNVDTWLRSPSIDGSSASFVALQLQRWLTVEDAVFDQAGIKVNGTPYFQNPTGNGSQQFLDTGWVQTVADISADAAGNPAFDLLFTLTSDQGLQFGGWNIDDVEVFATPAPSYSQGPRILAGPGHGVGNQNLATLFSAAGTPIVSFAAYAAGTMGTNVGAGDIDGDSYREALTGPGPGLTLGPQVRAFNAWDGSPIQKVNYFAYGTLRFGVNVSAGALDGDGFEEIVSGAGAGNVFGPHVRGWNFDAANISPIARINYFAYSTLKFGVLSAPGQVDTDSSFDEILTGAGPGAIFGAHLRGWNFDGATLSPLPNYSAFAFPNVQYGVQVAAANVFGASREESVAGKGPGPSNDAALKAFAYNNNGVLSQVAGTDLVAYPTMYGVRVAGGPLGARRDHLVAGPGPDPSAASLLKGWTYSQGAWQPDSSVDFPAFGTSYGTIAAVGNIQ